MREHIRNLIRPFREGIYTRTLAHRQGIKISRKGDYIEFNQRNKTVRISTRHRIYSNDIIESFDYYFEAVKPTFSHDKEFVDYSTGRYHEVSGFPLMPIFFPSFPEPTKTALQYLDFAELTPDSTVLDLGAYSGLTSIIFHEATERQGNIIAVDADEENVRAIKKNFALYKKISGIQIAVLHRAIWNHSRGLKFSSEGNMGSAATQIVGNSRGRNRTVESITLSDLVESHKIQRVDFIKCDIEGGESVIFDDEAFFENHRPKIIIEPHIVNGKSTDETCIAVLSRFGYDCRLTTQTGVTLPLLECRPRE